MAKKNNRNGNNKHMDIVEARKQQTKLTNSVKKNIDISIAETLETEPKENNKNTKSTSTNVVKVKKQSADILTKDDKVIVKQIRGKLRKTAETIVEIGTLIDQATNKRPRKFIKFFYKEIGMSDRSAQRYKQIATNAKIIQLQNDNQLEGKTMSDLITIISPKPTENKTKPDVKKVAEGFYSKYSKDKQQLQSIIDELQRLIKESEDKESDKENEL